MGKYARVGSPFNFLGHFSVTQKSAFYAWIKARKGNFDAIKEFHQIRSQQLRKTAGLLEAFYAKENLKPTFEKAAWSPTNHFTYPNRDDMEPALAMATIKERYKEQLQHDDEAVFWMNWLHCQIERQEDLAQHAFEANDDITALQTDIDAMFNRASFDTVLVTNETRYRVSQFDDPTSWERTLSPSPSGA
jgi:hypothetical protein